MNDIICPHCKKVFKVDEAGFADILKQVRDHVFDKELHERLELAEKEKENAVKLAKADIAKKDKELIELKAEKEKELVELLAKKEAEIADIKAKIDKTEVEKKLSVTEAVKIIEKDRDNLAGELKNKETEKQLLEKSLQEKYSTELRTKDEIIRMKDDENACLKDMKLKLSTNWE